MAAWFAADDPGLRDFLQVYDDHYEALMAARIVAAIEPTFPRAGATAWRRGSRRDAHSWPYDLHAGVRAPAARAVFPHVRDIGGKVDRSIGLLHRFYDLCSRVKG